MTRNAVLAVGSLALIVLLAGCVSGLGGGGTDAGEVGPSVILTHEIVPGHAGFPEETSALVQPCVPLGTYAPGMQPAWHVGVVDADTGEMLTNETVDDVVVTLDDGTVVQTSFNTGDGMWHGCVVLPDDAEEGTVDFTITVTIGDEEFEQAGSFNVVPRDQI